MWWTVILTDFGLIFVGAFIGFLTCAFLVNAKRADEQAAFVRIMDEIAATRYRKD